LHLYHCRVLSAFSYNNNNHHHNNNTKYDIYSVVYTALLQVNCLAHCSYVAILVCFMADRMKWNENLLGGSNL